MNDEYVCLVFQSTSAKKIDKTNWTNFECHVKVQPNKECKIPKHFWSNNFSFGLPKFY
jgi:hypothetical protein